MNFNNKFDKLYQDTVGLPDTGREYDSKISAFVSKYGNFKNEKYFTDLEQIIQNPNDEKAFLALCVLHTYLRRNKRYHSMKALEEKYQDLYGSYPAFQILHLRLEINIPSMPPEEQLEYAKRLSEEFCNNDGVTHDFCMLVANIYEQGNEHIRREIAINYIQAAKEIVDRVAEKKYPKFLWTKARIYSILSELEKKEEQRKRYYDIALKSISEAWMFEKPGEQYNTRIMTYRNYEVFIKNNYMLESTKRELNAISSQQSEMMEKIREEFSVLKSENLEILGFFVAIISFTIGLLTLAQNGPFIERICTIVVLMSALLFVYGGLGIVLHGKEKCGRNIIIMIMGILFIIAAAYAGLFL